jgi:hypothetical protein
MRGSDLPVLKDAVVAAAWAALMDRAGGRYRLHLERLGAEGELHYVAVARSLDVRPFAVVTTDLDELRRALDDADGQSDADEVRSHSSDTTARRDDRNPLATPGGFI